MAGLPPRSRSRSSSSTRKDRSPLETLQLMGFPVQRAEKAIAATGNRGIQLASDWLLSHVNDPLLDSPEPREYIIYLCPTGKLLENLVNYWDQTIQCCGWNSAHIYHPHITLCAFFKIPNNKVDVIDAVMNVANQEIGKWPSVGRLGLDLYTQNKNFIGYFVKSPHHQYIEQLMIRVQDEFVKHGIEMKPQMKQLHLTLAFQYEVSQHDVLLKKAQEININCSTTWEVRVFSRSLALKTAEVRRVIKHYKPVQSDELELTEGDYVYMDSEEHENSPDGWFKGTSWRTGVCAFFPGNFTVKCSQMEMWTLHRFASAPSLSASSECQNGADNAEPMDTLEARAEHYDNIWFSPENEQADVYAQVNKSKKAHTVKPRKLLIIRHAERCDFAFFKVWFDKSFTSDGEYRRFNLNCPKSVVPRSSFKDYSNDCPLTVIGSQQARITGDALRDAGESFSYVYCSPALRCVETATEILRGSGSNCDIFIEPSLFEWCGWYKPTMPNFMSPQELVKCGFPVDMSYNAYVNIQNIQVYETVEEYYVRSHNFTQHILRKHKSEGGNILLIGHSGTLDACTRQLQGKPLRNYDSFLGVVRGVPYCCICTAAEDLSTGKWALTEPPILPLVHGANKANSWRDLLE